jgi:hypothetical protein
MGIGGLYVWYTNRSMYIRKEFDFGTGVSIGYWKITGFAVDYEAKVFSIRLRGWTSSSLFDEGKTPLGTIELEFSERKRRQMREMYMSAVAEGAKTGPFDDTKYAFDDRFKNTVFTDKTLYEIAIDHPEMTEAIVNE